MKEAVFAAGAGAIGAYTECAFHIAGTGQFRPGAGANPHIGTPGDLETLPETRIEFVAPPRLRGVILSALTEAHPYEEPAVDIVGLHSTEDLNTACGLGRVGELPEPMLFKDLVQQVANALPDTVWGIRAAGDPEATVRTVAVSSGSGDSFLDQVSKLGVDVYVTSDLRHHPVDEHLRAGGPMIIDTAHWASEYPWTTQAAEILQAALPGVDVQVLATRTDPWTISAHKQTQD